MENVRDCPICLETPEREIYQCSEGHIICRECITKLTECPQCRTKYGTKRIRCRALELLLDGQRFECKFKKKGCQHLCQRSDISNHANSCEFNPEVVPVCEMFGCGNFRFRIDGGGGSKLRRSEIISHFTEAHIHNYHRGGQFMICWEVIKTGILKSTPVRWKHAGLLCTLSNEDTSPLFFVVFKINKTAKYLSIYCIQLWGEETKKYKVDFSLIKVTPSTESSTSKERDDQQNANKKLYEPVIRWTQNVCTPREAENMLKRCPIQIHIRALKDMKFGSNTQDSIQVNISLVT